MRVKRCDMYADSHGEYDRQIDQVFNKYGDYLIGLKGERSAAEVQDACLAIRQELSTSRSINDPSFGLAMIDLGLPSVVAARLQSEQLDEESAKELAWLLVNLAAGSRAETEAVMASGAVEPVVQAIETTIGWDLKEMGVWILSNLACEDTATLSLEAIGAVALVTRLYRSAIGSGICPCSHLSQTVAFGDLITWAISNFMAVDLRCDPHEICAVLGHVVAAFSHGGSDSSAIDAVNCNVRKTLKCLFRVSRSEDFRREAARALLCNESLFIFLNRGSRYYVPSLTDRIEEVLPSSFSAIEGEKQTDGFHR